jgi:DNA-binding transcriptional ArsR family regulator
MNGEPDIAAAAALFGDPSRAAILTALSDGRALPAGQLAKAAHVSPATTSFHLDKLVAGRLVERETQGRHNYYRLRGAGVARVLEALAVMAPSAEPLTLNQWRGSEQLRFARTCYGHLAGRLGIAVVDALLRKGYLLDDGSAFQVTAAGETWLLQHDIDVAALKRRPLTRKCIDWSERHHHLAGALGVALTKSLFEAKWLMPVRDSRAVRLTAAGKEGLQRELGVVLEET